MMINPNERTRIRVLLCDDHPMMLMGIRDFLSTQATVEIVDTAVTAEEVLAKSEELKPDIVIMDIGLRGTLNGIEAASLLKKNDDKLKVIFLTMHDEDEYIRQFIRSGASGYVLKESPPDELGRAIQSVYQGLAFFSPAISSKILKEKPTIDRPSSEELTDRELEVLKYIARGCTSKAIADKLYISERTVGTHRQAIMNKLNLHSIAELTRYAIAKKLI